MSAPLPSRDEIVTCLTSAKKPLHAGKIALLCGVSKDSYQRFLELLEQLAQEGTIRASGRSRFRAARGTARSIEGWEGVLSVNPKGFGFVTASGKPDVYVAPRALRGALHGDLVRIDHITKNPRGFEGIVHDIVERRNPRVAGVIQKRRTSVWLEPDDTRVRGPIVLTSGAKECNDGDAAVVEITRFPTRFDENPEGRLERVLGRAGEPSVEVAKIKVREQIEEEHPPPAMLEAEAFAQRRGPLELGKRTDLREIPFLTIDPSDARDHDDAVWATKTASGYRVYVAIADVSEYVRPGTALDDEARKRGCTIYLPDRAIPMLPSLLAADLCSLLPEQERYCLCAMVDLDEAGKVTSYEIHAGLMRAAAMITYDSVAKVLGFSDKPRDSPLAQAFKKDLKVLAQITAKLRRARLKRGALDLDLPEAKVELDPSTGAPEGIHQRAEDPGVKKAYQIVEELMLLANEVVARWLGKRKAPAVYRVHGRPDEEKLERLGAAAETLGAPFDFERMLEPNGVSQWLKKIHKHPKRAVLEGLLLRSLKQAVYDIVNIGHFGLASDAYLHFTSPIRRYPDLLVHRTVKHLLRGGDVDLSPNALETLRNAATHSSYRERAAMQVEREVVDLYRALFMRDKVGQWYEGTVTALVGSGIFVAIDSPYVEALIRFDSLGPDRYEISEDELSIVAQRSSEVIHLGDAVTVEIEDVSIVRRAVYGRRVFFEVESDQPAPERGKRTTRRGKKHEQPSPRTNRPSKRSTRTEQATSKAAKPARGKQRGRSSHASNQRKSKRK